MERKVIEIPLGKLVSDKKNPRKEFEEIEALADSLQANGQEEDVTVEDLKDGTYLIDNGHRRVEAFKVIKKRTGKEPVVRCVVRETLTAEERLVKRCVVDAQQKNWALTERDAAWKELWDLKKIKQGAFAKMIGVTESTVADFLDRCSLEPDIKKLLAKKEIGSDILQQTKTLDKDLRSKIIHKAVNEGISNRGVRRIMEAVRGQNKEVVEATINGDISIDQARQLEGMNTEKQGMAIKNIKSVNEQVKTIPRLVKNMDKPKTELQARRIKAQQFIDKLKETIANTASNLAIVESVLAQIEEDDLAQYFDARMKSSVVGFLEELDEEITPAMVRVKKTIKGWK